MHLEHREGLAGDHRGFVVDVVRDGPSDAQGVQSLSSALERIRDLRDKVVHVQNRVLPPLV